MNPYTSLTPASFNPLSLEEIMMVPLGKQKMHENAMAQADKLGLIDVNRLTVDDPYISEQVKSLKGKISSLEDNLMENGISKGLTKQLMDIKRERETFLSNDGAGGKAQNAYKAYQENVKQVYENKNLSEAQRAAGLSWALKKYEESGGVKAGGLYNPYRGANHVVLQDRALKYANEMSPQIIKQFMYKDGWVQSADGKRWIKGNVETTKLPADVIAKATLLAMSNDNEVIDYLKDAQKIGLSSDPIQEIQRAAATAGYLKERDDYSEDMSMMFTPGAKMDEATNDGGITNFNVVAAPNAEQEGSQFTGMDKLNKIFNERVDEAPLTKNLSYSTGLAPVGFGQMSTLNKRYNQMDKIPDEEAKPLLELAQDMIDSGIMNVTDENGNRITKATLDNKEIRKSLLDYANKYKNYRYDVAVVPDTTLGIGNYTQGINSKDGTAVMKYLNDNRTSAKFMDASTGAVMSWTDIQKETGADDITSTDGYVNFDNNLPTFAGKQNSSWKSSFVSPYSVVITGEDGIDRRYYMTRTTGEMESPRYKADTHLNNEIRKLRKTPEILKDVEIAGKKEKMMYLTYTEADKRLETLKDLAYDQNGNVLDATAQLNYMKLYSKLSEISSTQGLFYTPEYKDKDGVVYNSIFRTLPDLQREEYSSRGVKQY